MKTREDRMSSAAYRALAGKKGRRANKYGAKASLRCEACGSSAIYGGVCKSCGAGEVRRFDSKAEAAHWDRLRLLEQAGEIRDLQCQVPLSLFYGDIPIEYDNGRHASMVVDFSYIKDGKTVYEDSKTGIETQVSKLKRAVLRAMGIEVVLSKR